MKLMLVAGLVAWATVAAADIAVPVRTIRAREVIGAGDLTIKKADISGAVSDLSALVGKEARVILYPGRPVRPGDVGPPATVGRNDLVTLIFRGGGLVISTDGRALGRGAPGERIRTMNLSSRAIVTGRIRADGAIEVQQ